MSFFSPLRPQEQYVVACEVIKDETGHGTLHKGKYYHLDYEPTRDNRDYKCTGVKLIIRKNTEATKINHGFNNTPVCVYFKSGIFFNKGSYKNRLEHAIHECKQRIVTEERAIDNEVIRKEKAIHDAKVWELNEVSDREKAVAEHVKKIKKCQMRIDDTMKKLVPEAEPKLESKSHETTSVSKQDGSISITYFPEVDISAGTETKVQQTAKEIEPCV